MNVEVRRNTLLTASTGVVAGVVAAAYLTRAASGGTALDWVLALVLALIALVHAQGRGAAAPALPA